jgi:hypothetical protein
MITSLWQACLDYESSLMLDCRLESSGENG